MAYAELAGFPPASGLYASMVGMLAYALFGSSRQLVAGPDAATCAMLAAALGPLLARGTSGFRPVAGAVLGLTTARGV